MTAHLHRAAESVHGSGFPTKRNQQNQSVRWDRAVLSKVHQQQMDSPGYAQRFLPKCFSSLHAPHTPVLSLRDLLDNMSAITKLDVLAAADSAQKTEAATHVLNGLRLESRNDRVRVLHPRGDHVALCVTSITPSVPKLVKLLQRATRHVDFFAEARLFVTLQIIDQPAKAFNAAELRPLVAAAAAMRHVSFSFAPVRTCFEELRQTQLRDIAAAQWYTKHLRVNIHWRRCASEAASSGAAGAEPSGLAIPHASAMAMRRRVPRL